jgi:hypothetical protein
MARMAMTKTKRGAVKISTTIPRELVMIGERHLDIIVGML